MTDTISAAQSKAVAKYVAEIQQLKQLGVIVGVENEGFFMAFELLHQDNSSDLAPLNMYTWRDGYDYNTQAIAEFEREVDFWNEAQARARRVGVCTANN